MQVPVLDPPAVLDMFPNFADDGLLAGSSAQVLRAIAHLKLVMPRLGLRFSSLVVAAAAGEQHRVDFSAFRKLGCEVAAGGDFELLKSPIGSETFCKEYARKKAEKESQIVRKIGQIGDGQVGYYLLRWSGNASRLNYTMRTTPSQYGLESFELFDRSLENAFRSLTGLTLTQSQWITATFPVRQGGLGLRSAVVHADSAYIASRAATHAHCVALRPAHAWDVTDESGFLVKAMQSCNDMLGRAGMESRVTIDSPEGIRQQHLSKLLQEAEIKIWKRDADPDAICRLNAYSARNSGKVFDAVPSKTLDKVLSNCEFTHEVAGRLGVDVCDGGFSCNFCGITMDSRACHAASCMAGGDHTLAHNMLRDVVYDYSRRGLLRPESEASGLLSQLPVPEHGRRPADVLVVAGEAFAGVLPDGSTDRRFSKVAMDFAIVNALGQGHWTETFHMPAAASEAYAVRKSGHMDTALKCEAAGIRFMPMVFEWQGGMTKSADANLHRIAAGVATAEGGDVNIVKQELLQRIGLLLARMRSKAISRRLRLKDASQRQWATHLRVLERQYLEDND